MKINYYPLLKGRTETTARKEAKSFELNETNTRLPVDLSDEASQAAAGGREEGCADSSSVAPLYTLLCRLTAIWISLAVTNEVPSILWDFVWVFVSCTSLNTTK